MAFDGLVLYTIAEEMRQNLITGRVDKIYQPEPHAITMTLRCRGQNYHLLFSVNSQFARAHFTKEKFTNPPHPPAFCMLLRKYLVGGRVVEIKQPGFERILTIVIQNLNEVGDVVQYRLIAELMGRHSNLILVSQDDVILDGLKRIPAGISRHRQVLPGQTYIDPPEQDKANPLMAEKDAFIALVRLEPENKVFRAVMNNYRGISPLNAREIATRANLNPKASMGSLQKDELERLWQSFAQYLSDLQNGATQPTLVSDETGKILAYSCFPLTQYQDQQVQTFASMSELLDYYFTKKVKGQLLDQISSDIKRTIRNLLEKDVKKLDKLKAQLEEAENAEEYRIKGEMITASLHKINKGDSVLKAINYYDPEMKEMTIELDPSISPQRNAKKYFKRYNKLKSSVKYVQKELRKLKPEIDYLKNVEHSIEQIESRADYEEIREELIQEGYIRENRKATPNRQRSKSKPMQFVSSDGFDIMVGRNNRQNDKLTKSIAARDDLWFHVKEIPGSHVVIRNHDRRDIPDRTLEEAAVLAAYYSKARESTHVSVDFTQIKYVNKPRGAKPGLVFYENYQTVTVHPDPDLVEKLRKD